MYITDENDIYTYLHVINDIKPKSVIDIGMFLKRIGAISRQARNVSIDETIKLDALDVLKTPPVAVYETVYDAIYDENILQEMPKYDLAMVLCLEQHMSAKTYEAIWKWTARNVKYALTDDTKIWTKGFFSQIKDVRTVSVDEQCYSLLVF